MSGFGRPPGTITFSPTPPQRGSFPLDHDGECKPVMTEYLACLKRVRGQNDPECRLLAKAYLKCRMDRQLMAADEWRNLGFQDEGEGGRVGEGERKGGVVGGGGGGEDRLEQLRRENRELLKKRLEEEAAAGKK